MTTATISTSALTVGTHTVTATYSGDSNFVVSSGSLSGGGNLGGQDGPDRILRLRVGGEQHGGQRECGEGHRRSPRGVRFAAGIVPGIVGAILLLCSVATIVLGVFPTVVFDWARTAAALHL